MEKYKTFLASYNFAGKEYGIEFMAKDRDEAERRLARLAFARLDGELVATVPEYLGPFMAVLIWVRNILKRIFDNGKKTN